MVQIYISADDVWSFFQKNKNRLSEEMVVIAENENTDYTVYLTEYMGKPLFSVCKGKLDPEFEEEAIDEQDCAETAKRCYVKYLFPTLVSSDSSAGQFSEYDDIDDYWQAEELDEKEEAICERENELQIAMADFLQVVLQEGCDGTDIIEAYGEGMVADILDNVLEFLGFDLGFPIYRPTIITDDATHEEIYEEYPYSEPYEEESRITR